MTHRLSVFMLMCVFTFGLAACGKRGELSLPSAAAPITEARHG